MNRPTDNQPDTTESPESLEVLETPVATGFEPPADAIKARFKRLNLETGGWEDAPVIHNGIKTPTVEAGEASPNLPIAERIPTTYRITWYGPNNRVLGYTKVWKLVANPYEQGGASNTPPMWPPGSPHRGPNPQGGYLSSTDTLSLMRGLSLVVHEASAPLIAQVNMFAEQTLARERAFHEARLAAERERYRESVERDRAFLAAMRQVHERPRERRIADLEAQLAELQSQEDDEPSQQLPDPWDVAGKLVEHAPEIIKAVGNEFRNRQDPDPDSSD